MRMGKQLRGMAALAGLGGAIALLPHCSAKDLANAAKGCDGLDAKANKFDASVHAFVDAMVAFNAAGAKVEAQWHDVCLAVDTELKLDITGKSTAAELCGVLNARIQSALAKGVTMSLSVEGSCQVNASVEADCQASCTVSGGCDITASCEPGKLVVDCAGTCDAQCDVTAPSVDCQGQCTGTCDGGSVAVACEGTCEGTCTAPKWTGTCETGCSVNFSGSCQGSCDGTCDGTTVKGGATGNCQGKCVGSCTAKASGSCETACTGQFTAGHCDAECKGKCTVTSKPITCSGKCNGTCTYTKPSATCNGACHGHCVGTAQPPRCEGTITCTNLDAKCQSSCQARAQASATCSGHANYVVSGDVPLYNALVHQAAQIGAAFKATAALAGPFTDVVGKFWNGASAAADLTGAGVVCIGATMTVGVGVQAQAHVSVSVEASATVSGSAKSS